MKCTFWHRNGEVPQTRQGGGFAAAPPRDIECNIGRGLACGVGSGPLNGSIAVTFFKLGTQIILKLSLAGEKLHLRKLIPILCFPWTASCVLSLQERMIQPRINICSILHYTMARCDTYTQ